MLKIRTTQMVKGGDSWRQQRHLWLAGRTDRPKPRISIYTMRRVLGEMLVKYRDTYYPGGAYQDVGERMGLLLGSLTQVPDSEKWVVEIQGFVECPHTDTSITHATMSTQEMLQPLMEAQERYRAACAAVGTHASALLVGWYHTHPKMSLFLSGPDVETYNSLFPETWQVALVFDPSRWHGAFFLREPDSRVDGTQGDWREFDMRAEAMQQAMAAAPTERAQPILPAVSSPVPTGFDGPEQTAIEDCLLSTPIGPDDPTPIPASIVANSGPSAPAAPVTAAPSLEPLASIPQSIRSAPSISGSTRLPEAPRADEAADEHGSDDLERALGNRFSQTIAKNWRRLPFAAYACFLVLVAALAFFMLRGTDGTSGQRNYVFTIQAPSKETSIKSEPFLKPEQQIEYVATTVLADYYEIKVTADDQSKIEIVDKTKMRINRPERDRVLNGFALTATPKNRATFESKLTQPSAGPAMACSRALLRISGDLGAAESDQPSEMKLVEVELINCTPNVLDTPGTELGGPRYNRSQTVVELPEKDADKEVKSEEPVVQTHPKPRKFTMDGLLLLTTSKHRQLTVEAEVEDKDPRGGLTIWAFEIEITGNLSHRVNPSYEDSSCKESKCTLKFELSQKESQTLTNTESKLRLFFGKVQVASVAGSRVKKKVL